jgi:hypothetical protein
MMCIERRRDLELKLSNDHAFAVTGFEINALLAAYQGVESLVRNDMMPWN